MVAVVFTFALLLLLLFVVASTKFLVAWMYDTHHGTDRAASRVLPRIVGCHTEVPSAE
jgi:hypothetical protein